MGEGSYIIAFVTASNEAEAEAIARPIVEKGLAACVNIIPKIRSVYKWQGKLEASEEVLMVIKTVAKNFNALKEEVVRLHSYEVPEIICTQISEGSERYLNWINENTI